MPNAIYNYKCKTSRSIKVEKENENRELRTRMLGTTKDKHASNKKESVWDRLSKVQKVPSMENTLGVTRSRHNITMKTTKRFQATRQITGNQIQQPQVQMVSRKPLSPNACSLNGRWNPPKKTHLTKAIVGPEIENQRIVYVCKHNKLVNEILSARSLKTSSDDNKTSNRTNFRADCKVGFAAADNGESTEESNDEYKLAPLMSSRSYRDNSSITIANYVRGLLQHQDKCMAPEDIELVNDVIKSDGRYQELNECNPKLFKDILKTQLQDILKHEFAVKRALDKLDSSVSLQSNQLVEMAQSAEGFVSSPNKAKELQKLEVDVIFKNVPSLEKEIIILRALGEKLEATLKNSSSQRGVASIKSQTSLDSMALFAIESPDKRVLIIYEKYDLATENFVQLEVRVFGIRYMIAIVKEYYIAQKTIDELQQDINRPFYIPINQETAELKRTSFKKLKENPDILLRHIKPKNSVVAFNVLEQDPVFFNNIIFSKTHTISKLSLAVSTNGDYYAEDDQLQASGLREGGDSCSWLPKEDNKITVEPIEKSKENPKDQELSKLKFDCDASESFQSTKPTKLKESVISGHQRRRIRRSMTPMPPGQKDLTPKNTLLKTILVGSLQLHLFLLLIMAFTFPNPKC